MKGQQSCVGWFCCIICSTKSLVPSDTFHPKDNEWHVYCEEELHHAGKRISFKLVGILIKYKGLAFYNDRLVWRFHYESNIDPPRNCSVQHTRLLYICSVIPIVQFLICSLYPKSEPLEFLQILKCESHNHQKNGYEIRNWNRAAFCPYMRKRKKPSGHNVLVVTDLPFLLVSKHVNLQFPRCPVWRNK